MIFHTCRQKNRQGIASVEKMSMTSWLKYNKKSELVASMGSPRNCADTIYILPIICTCNIIVFYKVDICIYLE